MATSFIDLESAIGMVQYTMLANTSLTSKLDIQQMHEPIGDGVTKPAVGILGITDIAFAGRSTGSSDRGTDEATGTLQIMVLHTIGEFTTNRYRAEGATSLLIKHLCESGAITDTSVGNGALTSGHIIHIGSDATKCRVTSASGPGNEEGQVMRMYQIDLPIVIQRSSGANLAIEA